MHTLVEEIDSIGGDESFELHLLLLLLLSFPPSEL